MSSSPPFGVGGDQDKGNPVQDDREENPQKGRKEEERKDRDVEVSIKIKSLARLDVMDGSFRIRFHVYLTWMAETEEKEEYDAVMGEEVDDDGKQAQPQEELEELQSPGSRNARTLDGRGQLRGKPLSLTSSLSATVKRPWEPKWRPVIEVANASRVKSKTIGTYAVTTLDGKDDESIYWVRVKVEYEAILSESFELENFPFDCQDLVLHLKDTKGKGAEFKPMERLEAKGQQSPAPDDQNAQNKDKSAFLSVMCKNMSLTGWLLSSAKAEFSMTDKRESRGKKSYSQVHVRLKLQRKWAHCVLHSVLPMMTLSALALTTFALDDLGSRFGHLATLLIALVAHMYLVQSKLPAMPYLSWMDWYLFVSFIFVSAMLMLTAYGEEDLEEHGTGEGWRWVWGAIQIVFLVWAVAARRWVENPKLRMWSGALSEHRKNTCCCCRWPAAARWQNAVLKKLVGRQCDVLKATVDSKPTKYKDTVVVYTTIEEEEDNGVPAKNDGTKEPKHKKYDNNTHTQGADVGRTDPKDDTHSTKDDARGHLHDS